MTDAGLKGPRSELGEILHHLVRDPLGLAGLIIVTVIGTDHPPTANDRMPLGRFRVVLGTASLILPFICFPPHGLFME